MEDGQPTFSFEGIDRAGTDLYSTIKPHAIAGIDYVKETYATQAPKVSAAVHGLVKQAQEMVIGSVEPTLVKIDSPIDAVPPVINAGASSLAEVRVGTPVSQTWFARTGNQLNHGCIWVKDYAKAHPIITGVAVAAVIAVPVIVYLAKAKKAKGQK